MTSRTVESRRCLHLKGFVRKCSYFSECGKIETHDGYKWREHWHNHNNNLICRNHYNNLVSNPKRTPEYHRKYNSRITPEQHKIYQSRITKDQIRKWSKSAKEKRLQFKDRRLYLRRILRTGYCSWCSNNKLDGSCKRTSLHHLIYITILPWFGTVEICNKCHTKETRRLEKTIL